ncbi:MAG: hypothetical protein HYV28_15260 [Ignavibacteriales bacterium]|nr:hypothetical protein [Ignavibacteriales bacterium]
MRSIFTSLFFFLIFCTGMLFSQTPSTLSMQGVLRDATGAAVADGNYAMTFKIYSTPTGGVSLWSETQSAVMVQNGVYNAQLGSVTPFGSLAFNQQYWIGITTGNIEMSPRVTLTAAPYAMGFRGSSNVFGGSGNVGIGTLEPATKLTVSGGVQADTLTSNGNINGVTLNSTTINNTGNSTIGGNQTVTGTGTFGNATISGNATINGTATIDTANVTTLNTSSLTVNNNASVNGTLGVGTSAPASGSKLDVSGPIFVSGEPFFKYISFTTTEQHNGQFTLIHDTGYSSTEWVGCVVGFEAGNYDATASAGRRLAVRCYESGGTVWVRLVYPSENTNNMTVNINLLLIKKNMVEFITQN